MKKTLLISLAFAVILPVFAQKTRVTEGTEKIGESRQNCLIVFIPDVSDKNISSAWKDKMKKTGGKISGKKVMFTDNASLPAISQNTVDVYTIIEKTKGGVNMINAFDLGGAYLNSKDHSDKYGVAEKMIYDFAVEQAKSMAQKKVDDQKKMVEKSNKKIEGIEKDNKKLNSKIEDYKKDIVKAEKDIEKNKAEIEKITRENKDQNNALQKLEKELKDIE